MHKSLNQAVTAALAHVTPESRRLAREIDWELSQDPLDPLDEAPEAFDG